MTKSVSIYLAVLLLLLARSQPWLPRQVPSLSSSLTTEVYNPKTFFPHAASLGQTFVHCPIFPTAASRRSLDRFSVPMWPFNLSVRLLIVDLVSRYLTNYLIRRESIYLRLLFDVGYMRNLHVMRYQHKFPCVIPLRQAGYSRVTHPSATDQGAEAPVTVRLECVMHAASVHPEPGSNSLKNCIYSALAD